MENTKTAGLLFKGSEFCSTFWQSNCHNFGYISGKVAKPHFFRNTKRSQNGPSSMLFFNFCLFPFSKFQMTIVKNLLMDFECFTNIFDLHIFHKETVLLNFFEICTEMHFVSLFFLNEWNITTTFLMIHLKCTVVHYSSLNSSSINKPFLDYGPLNLSFLLFFLIFYLHLFQRGFGKKIMK